MPRPNAGPMSNSAGPMTKASRNTAGPTPPRSPVSQTASPSSSALVTPTSSISGTLSSTSRPTKPSVPALAPGDASASIPALPTWPASVAGPLPQTLVKARPATPMTHSNDADYPNGSNYSMSISDHSTEPLSHRPLRRLHQVVRCYHRPTHRQDHATQRRENGHVPITHPLLQVSASTASRSSSLQDATTDLPKGRKIG